MGRAAAPQAAPPDFGSLVTAPTTDASWWQVLLGVGAGLLVVWLALLLVLWWAQRRAGDATTWTDACRLMPDVVRLLGRLAVDRQLPTGVRLRLVVLLAYLLSPIDLVPDVIPVIGYADDVIVTAVVLRSIVRRAGPEALDRHWPGSPEGLAVVRRLAGITA